MTEITSMSDVPPITPPAESEPKEGLIPNKRVYDSHLKRIQPEEPKLSVDEIVGKGIDPESRPETPKGYQVSREILDVEYGDTELLSKFQHVLYTEAGTQGQHDGILAIYEAEMAKGFDGDVEALFARHQEDITKLGLSVPTIRALKNLLTNAREEGQRDIARRRQTSLKVRGVAGTEARAGMIRTRERSAAYKDPNHKGHPKVMKELKNLYAGKKP